MLSETLPSIRISSADRRALEPMVLDALADGHPVAPFLLGEIHRAEVCPDAVPADTVTVNNWVTYRLDWGFPSESRLLVAPADYRNPAIHLSVLSPLGAALIGLRVGCRMPFREIEGTLHVATVESLDPPLGLYSLLRLPDRARRRDAAPAPAFEPDPDDPGPSAA